MSKNINVSRTTAKNSTVQKGLDASIKTIQSLNSLSGCLQRLQEAALRFEQIAIEHGSEKRKELTR